MLISTHSLDVKWWVGGRQTVGALPLFRYLMKDVR